MSEPDPADSLLLQIRIATEFGDLSDREIDELYNACGMPDAGALPHGYVNGGPLWAWHGPLLIGFGRICRGPRVISWIDRIAVIPEYRNEGIEAEILLRLALVEKRFCSPDMPLLVGTAQVPTTIGLIVGRDRAPQEPRA